MLKNIWKVKRTLLDLKVLIWCQKLSLQNLIKKLQTVALNSSEIYVVNAQLDNSTVKLTLKHIVDFISGLEFIGETDFSFCAI